MSASRILGSIRKIIVIAVFLTDKSFFVQKFHPSSGKISK